MVSPAAVTGRIWTTIAPLHDAILEHPFLRGLGDGSLPEPAFRRFVVQDALYLRDYARALALCGVRAGDAEALRMFCRHAAEAVEVERALHVRLMEDLGIDARAAAADEPSPTCLGYTSFLLQACAVGERHEALAAILPCYWIYWRVGTALAGRGSPDPRYATWIATYAGEDFGRAAEEAIAATGRALAGIGDDAMRAALGHALTAARFEWLFWDAAWRGEGWPVGGSGLDLAQGRGVDGAAAGGAPARQLPG